MVTDSLSSATPSDATNDGRLQLKAEIETEISQITRIPDSTVDLDAASGRKVLKLMEALDDHDDVQNVSANFNIPDEVMAELSADR